MKNIATGVYKSASERNLLHNKVVYITILGKGDEADRDWKVDCGKDSFTVTDMGSGATFEHRISNFDFEHNSLIKLDMGAETETLQFLGQENDLKFNFYYKGGHINTMVYDETQYKYKKHMAPPTKVDHSRSVLSPMPGAIVSINVEVGQTVVDGQDLCVVEAMKMQNILKSERDGKIKSVKVKAGDSVAVDELLIEFE